MARTTSNTKLGVPENIGGALCYVLGFITGIIFYLVEDNNKFVRFHAVQSIIVFGGLFVLNLILSIMISILSFVPLIGWIVGILGGLLQFAGLILWIVLMVKAYQGEEYKLPIVREMAEKYIGV
ncbi:MAG: DUF4870 domain-containing protein [Candidatus Hydrothermarchaeaceae archaeon]